MTTPKSEASVALTEQSGLLFNDTTSQIGRANLEAKAVVSEYPYIVFGDGSVIESDPLAGSIKSTPAGHWNPEKVEAFRKRVEHEKMFPTPPMLTRVSGFFKSMLPTTRAATPGPVSNEQPLSTGDRGTTRPKADRPRIR